MTLPNESYSTAEGSNQSSNVVYFPTAAAQKAIEDCIKEANDLRDEFETLQKKLDADEILKFQYTRYLEKKLTEGDATKAFKELLGEFNQAAKKYNILKEEIDKHLGKPQVAEIEKSAQMEDKKFFPLFQSFYDQEVAKIKEETRLIHGRYTTKKENIETAYSDRSFNYKSWHCIMGGLCIIGVGAPFFLGGLVVHALDKIIKELRILSADSKIKKADHKEEAIENLNKNLEVKSKAAPDTLLKQRFFKTAQSYEKKIADVVKPERSFFHPR